MNKKSLTIHLFCLLLFIGGCGLFWLFGGGEEQSESLNYIYDGRLECQATEVGREQSSHNTSMCNRGDEAEKSQLSLSASKISIEDTIKEEHQQSAEIKKKATKHAAKLVESQPIKESEPSAQPITASKSVGFNHMAGNSNSVDGDLIKAALYEEQKSFSPASPVKIRLMDDVKVGGVGIPKNTIVYAKAMLSDDRVYLCTETIIYKKKDYPFNAVVFDMDEREGLKISDGKIALPAGYRVIMKRK